MTSVYLSFEDVHKQGETFGQRIGDPTESVAALGHIIVGFSWLEEAVEGHIATLAHLSKSIAPAVTSEMSFKTKVAVLSSLVRIQPPIQTFNCGNEQPMEVWDDILKMISSCEELRNRILHSRWSYPFGQDIARTKTTAKAAHGIRVTSENLTSHYLLDVYDYILNVETILNEFFLL
jgi:hypothetical protein